MTTLGQNSRAQRFERLIEVCRNLGKSEDVTPLLQTIVNASCDLTYSQFCYLLVYEQETDLLKIAAGPPNFKEILKQIRIPIEKSIAGWAYTKSKPATLQNAQNDPKVFRDIERALGYTTQSILAVPLIFKGQTIGVLEVINKQNNNQYTEDDLIILDTLASQAAVATISTLLFEESKQAYDEVQELDRMKTDFIAIASHELRTPLGLILGHATYLRELIKDEPDKIQLDVIIRNSLRLKKIIDDLSNVNSFTTGAAKLHGKKVFLNQLISKTAKTYQDVAEKKKISFVINLPNSDIILGGDEEKLGIAINNLISNAINFTNEKGHIWISAEKLPGYVQLSVIDDGIGIPAKDLTKIFERFYQVQSHLTRRHGGMGLGLSVAKAMVEMHKGQIWAESIEGKGSKFYILLPIGNSSTPFEAESVFKQ
jgi:signal transduction histidine kinase